MLAATGRSPMRASHLHFMVTAPGYRTLVTHIFVRGDELLDSDTVFGVMDSLIKDFVAQPPGTPAPNGRDLSGSGWSKSCWRRCVKPPVILRIPRGRGRSAQHALQESV